MKQYRKYLMVRPAQTSPVQVRSPKGHVVWLAKNVRAAHQWIWRATQPKQKG